MKANETPEKIYINFMHKTLMDMLSVKVNNDDIEYIRADAFIEKAWDWIEDNILSSNQQDKSRFYYEQFINYMKG